MCDVAKKNLDGNRIIRSKQLIIISLAFMSIGFVFCFLYDYSILRYILAAIGLIIIVIFSKKIFLVVKVMFSSSKNEICS